MLLNDMHPVAPVASGLAGLHTVLLVGYDVLSSENANSGNVFRTCLTCPTTGLHHTPVSTFFLSPTNPTRSTARRCLSTPSRIAGSVHAQAMCPFSFVRLHRSPSGDSYTAACYMKAEKRQAMFLTASLLLSQGFAFLAFGFNVVNQASAAQPVLQNLTACFRSALSATRYKPNASIGLTLPS